MDRAMYGIILDRMIICGLIGETSSTSIVPVSFSLTMAMDVIMAQMRMIIRPMTPGTKL